MKTEVPCVEAWLSLDKSQPCLIGTRCASCGTMHFPPEHRRCHNPHCGSAQLLRQALSRLGRLWSYTNAVYQPPPPYLPRTEPYQPIGIAAVELEKERMVVLGQLEEGVAFASLRIGMHMELTVGVLNEDAHTRTLTWMWRPVFSRETSR